MDRIIDIEKVYELDKSDMYTTLKRFPNQVEEACQIGLSAPEFPQKPQSSNFLILGMGGSAIGGDLLRSFFSKADEYAPINIVVNRNYSIPKYIDSTWNVIASSYSGATEETLSAFDEAYAKTKNIMTIASGGPLLDKARALGLPTTVIPGGFQPRAALGYSFFPMLISILRSGAVGEGAIEKFQASMSRVLHNLKNKAQIYCVPDLPENPAIEISAKIFGTTPVIYSAGEALESVNLRWRCQIQENAKNMAFGGLLPEMNHNEINSWEFPIGAPANCSLVFLEDISDHRRTKTRIAAVRSLIGPLAKSVVTVEARPDEDLLARTFSLIYLGDWVSFYLAIRNGIDPTPIPLISQLKEMLSKS